MSPDPSLDPNRTALPDPMSGLSDASDSTQVRTKARTPGAGLPAAPGVLHIPGYEVTKLLARGGMGAIYAARDLTLDREVAIKTLLPGADPDRFVTEAKITARLPHPGILPVHALGTMPDGGHFLVMKFVLGDTLAQLLKDRPSPVFGLPRFVQVFEQIAQAVGFAHSRGVLHRDLKPLNVMVGAFGEVQVMDWGLAKDQANPGRESGGDRSGGDRPDDPEHTRVGEVMGTPGYMAPEQARGEAVDARADVFALGSVLAAVLTGQPAFVGSTARETVDRAAAADLDDVRARLSACGADPELVALARRCLSASAADRPSDARAVAAEVAEYRAGVEARLRQAETDRARAETQAAEQAKRRRVVQWAAGGIAAVLLAGVVGTAIGLVRAEDARESEKERADGEARETLAKEEQRAIAVQNEERANRETLAKEEQRVRAVKSEGVTRDTYTQMAEVLDAMVTEAAGDSLATQKVITPEQRKFLTEVLSYYRKFAAAAGTDEQTRSRTANAAFRVGMIESRLGRTDEGATAFERARDEFAGLAADFPTAPEYRAALANGRNNLGLVLKDLGKKAEAGDEFHKALAIRLKLAADFPTLPQYQADLAKCHNNLGVLLKDLGKRAEAEDEYRKGLAIQLKLAADFTNVPNFRNDLAGSHANLGNLLSSQGKRAEAEDEYRKALAILLKLAADFPTPPLYRPDLAKCHNNLGVLLKDLGKRAEAEDESRKGLAIQLKLAADFPTVPQYRADLAASHNNLGALLFSLGKGAEAEDEFRKGLAIRQTLATDFPTVPQYRADLAANHNNLGLLLSRLGKRVEAEEEYRKGLVIQMKLAADFPTVPRHWTELARSHSNLGELLKALGKQAEAEDEYRNELAIRLKLAADFPTLPELRAELARGHSNLGNLLSGLGKGAEAEDEYRKGLAIRQKLTAEFPAAPEYRSDLARSHNNLGNLYLDTSRHKEAIEQARLAIQADPKFSNAHAMLGDLLQRTGDIPAARTAFTEAARLDPRFKGLLADLEKKFPPLPVAPPPREKR